MSQLKLSLMYQDALKRLRDANILFEAIGLGEQSDSPHLLRLLALELFLKVVFEFILQRPAHGHKYEELFNALPDELQKRLLAEAGEHIGPSALTEDHTSVLKELGQNFVALRYPWERYAELSEEEYSRIGNEWAAKGSPLEEAVFRYHPRELDGIIAALKNFATTLPLEAQSTN